MDKKKWNIIGGIILIIILLGSYLGLFIKPKNNDSTISVGYSIVYNKDVSKPVYNKVPLNFNLGNFLYNFVPGVSFESDYDLRTVNNIENDFFNGDYWQILVNNNPVNDLSYVLKDNDLVTLYYGPFLNIFNLSVNLVVDDINQSNNVLINGDTSISSILSSYNVSFVNGSVNCLFNICSDVNNSWSVLVNNVSVSNFNYSFSKGDVLSLIFK